MVSSKVSSTVRKAMESLLYEGCCTVYIQDKSKHPITKETIFNEAVLFSDQSCRVSYSTLSSANDIGHATGVAQTIKLFVSPDIRIPSGSKIVVTQNGATVAYSNSGEAALYATHQEILLTLFNGWA